MKYRKLKVGDKRPEGYEYRNRKRFWFKGDLEDEVVTKEDFERVEYRVPIRPKKARKK